MTQFLLGSRGVDVSATDASGDVVLVVELQAMIETLQAMSVRRNTRPL